MSKYEFDEKEIENDSDEKENTNLELNPEKWDVNESETSEEFKPDFSAENWEVEDVTEYDKHIAEEDTTPEDSDKTETDKDEDKDNDKDEDNNSPADAPTKDFGKVLAWIIIILVVLTITAIIYVFNIPGVDNNSNESTSNYTDETTEFHNVNDVETTYSSDNLYEIDLEEGVTGKCGNNADFWIGYATRKDDTKYVKLNITGSGEMWTPDKIDWEINDLSIVEEIWVTDSVSKIQEKQFCNFGGVKIIYFNDKVSYIGRDACSGISTLKKVYIFNPDCKIDWTDSDGYIYSTLGNADGSVTIICYYDSTAYDYFTVWNDNYPNSYEINSQSY